MEKILVIDDESVIRESMTAYLEDSGFLVCQASDGREGLAVFRREHPDLVMVDLRMPGIDGLEALKILKEKKPELQVILLTGHATVEKGIEAMKLGAMDFLEKPADLSQLTEKIKKAQAKKMLIVEKQNEDKIKKILEEKGW